MRHHVLLRRRHLRLHRREALLVALLHRVLIRLQLIDVVLQLLHLLDLRAEQRAELVHLERLSLIHI